MLSGASTTAFFLSQKIIKGTVWIFGKYGEGADYYKLFSNSSESHVELTSILEGDMKAISGTDRMPGYRVNYNISLCLGMRLL